MHPEAVVDRPQRLRWVMRPGTIGRYGEVLTAPGLEGFLANGTLEHVEVEPGAVVTDLTPGEEWSYWGARVRTALLAAATDPENWVVLDVTGRAGYDGDRALGETARRVLEGPLGDYIASHGGRIELLEARAGVVRVRMCGACRGCPAASLTLRLRLERDLKAECSAFRELVAVE